MFYCGPICLSKQWKHPTVFSPHIWPLGGDRDLLVVLETRTSIPENITYHCMFNRKTGGVGFYFKSTVCHSSSTINLCLPLICFCILKDHFFFNLSDVWWVLLDSCDRWGGVTDLKYPLLNPFHSQTYLHPSLSLACWHASSPSIMDMCICVGGPTVLSLWKFENIHSYVCTLCISTINVLCNV